jgi:hypothetical protein
MFVFEDVELSGPLPLLLNKTAVPGTVFRTVEADATDARTSTAQAPTTPTKKRRWCVLITAPNLSAVSRASGGFVPNRRWRGNYGSAVDYAGKARTVFRGAFLNAFPDCQFTSDDMIAEGDRVATKKTFSGTHTGEFNGIAATGRHVSITFVDILRLRDGKLVEHWLSMDQLSFMQQLGVLPTKPSWRFGRRLSEHPLT